MGSSQPFRTFTKRCTTETEARSFANSVSTSGYSTATKTVSSKSRSTQGGVNVIVAGAKGKRSTAKKTTDEEKSENVDSTERNEELTSTATQAVVSEFTIMPMKTFRLREGGLNLTPYAYYRLREYL